MLDNDAWAICHDFIITAFMIYYDSYVSFHDERMVFSGACMIPNSMCDVWFMALHGARLIMYDACAIPYDALRKVINAIRLHIGCVHADDR